VHGLPEVGTLLQHLLLGLPSSGVAVPATTTWKGQKTVYVLQWSVQSGCMTDRWYGTCGVDLLHGHGPHLGSMLCAMLKQAAVAAAPSTIGAACMQR
jgi:hypothetical protein